MTTPGRILMLLGLALMALVGCGRLGKLEAAPNPIVGAWVVEDPAAPFRYHMYAFRADGTMQQSNPEAGHVSTSDSDGMGMWEADAHRPNHIKGKWVEITADRATHQPVGRVELLYELTVEGDGFRGTLGGSAISMQGKVMETYAPGPLTGARVKLP